MAVWIQRARQEQVVIGRLEADGATIIHNWQFANGTFVPDARSSRGWVSRLLGFDPWSHAVGLGSPPADLDDDDMPDLLQLRSLKVLHLEGTKITDWSLSLLTGLRSLEILNLRGTAVSDHGLRDVGRITSLRTLMLDGTNISDAGLRELERLQELEEVGLSRTRITDEGIPHLLPLRRLRLADVSETSVTENGVIQLAECGKLERLMVSTRQISADRAATLERQCLVLVCRLQRSPETGPSPASCQEPARGP